MISFFFIYIHTYSISQKWVHPSHFSKYFNIYSHVTTLKKWHFQGSRVRPIWSHVRPIWSHVRPNFSRVRLKKIWGRTCATSPSRREKKYPRLWVSLCFYNRHTLGSYRGLISEIISGSLSPIRESEGRTPNVCLWCIFAIPKSDARSRSRGGVSARAT